MFDAFISLIVNLVVNINWYKRYPKTWLMLKMEYEINKGRKMIEFYNKTESAKYGGNVFKSHLGLFLTVHGSIWGDYLEDAIWRDKGIFASMPWKYIYNKRTLYMPPTICYFLLPTIQMLVHGMDIFRYDSVD